MRSDITPGGILPDYALPRPHRHHPHAQRAAGPRSTHPHALPRPLLPDPKEHQQHLELAAFQSKIAVACTQMVTISTDDHHTLQEFRASVGARWTFLSDPGRIIQKNLDIQEYTDPEHDPMIPHTLVLKPGLVIHSISNGYWLWGRPSVYDLWLDLRAATSEIRPDRDLSTPGLREAWDAGDWSHFHGWDRQSGQPLDVRTLRVVHAAGRIGWYGSRACRTTSPGPHPEEVDEVLLAFLNEQEVPTMSSSRISRRRAAALAAGLAVTGVLATATASSAAVHGNGKPKPTVVLVHGAFATRRTGTVWLPGYNATATR